MDKNKKIDKVIELIKKEREFVEYIECPNCAELTWDTELSVCKNCNFVD